MNNEYEHNENNLLSLADWYDSNVKSRNEATTRLHLINKLFFDCLGWKESEVTVEDSHERSYADYVFSSPQRVMVVEAKKENTRFELPAGHQKKLEWSLATLRRNHANLRSALDQVASYCQERGIPIACVTNGHQLVVFIAVRSDGIAPMEGRALVFDGFDSMRENFLELWQVLSRDGVLEGRLSRRLSGDATPTLPPKMSDHIPGYPGYQERNSLQTDFQILSDTIIEDIARHRDHEPEFLADTYCKSGALSQYAEIAKQILTTRYSALFDESSRSPQITPAVTKSGISPEIMADSLSRRPILLIGDVGVGKTMFIRQLMVTDESDLFKNAVALYIDLGEKGTLSSDLRGFIVQEMIAQLDTEHDINIDERNFIQGVYHTQLQRFKKGIFADLREADPNSYRLKKIEYLGELTSDKVNHLKHSLEHLCKARRKQVVVFLDNADQRDKETQETVFLIAQELAAQWKVSVFVALRPETFHQSQRKGVLSAYHPRAFSIEPPRIDLVVKKRLKFARRITRGKLTLTKTSDMRLDLASLDLMVAAFIRSMDDNEDLIKAIDNMSGGNIRVGLDLIRQFFGSGHINTDKIIDILRMGGNYIIPLHEFLRAVIHGDNRHYRPERSPVTNLFSVSSIDRREHFLIPVCLTVIRHTGGNDGWLDTDTLIDHVQSFGFHPAQIDAALQKSTERGLIETSGRRQFIREENFPNEVRIRTPGVYHLDYLLPLFVYVDAVIVDTPILEDTWRSRIILEELIEPRLDRAELFLEYLDESWQQFTASNAGFDWLTVSEKCRNDIQQIRDRLRRKSRHTVR